MGEKRDHCWGQRKEGDNNNTSSPSAPHKSLSAGAALGRLDAAGASTLRPVLSISSCSFGSLCSVSGVWPGFCNPHYSPIALPLSVTWQVTLHTVIWLFAPLSSPCFFLTRKTNTKSNKSVMNVLGHCDGNNLEGTSII